MDQTSLSSSDCKSSGICSIFYSPNMYLQNDDPVDNIIISACNTIKCRNTSFSGDIGNSAINKDSCACTGIVHGAMYACGSKTLSQRAF